MSYIFLALLAASVALLVTANRDRIRDFHNRPPHRLDTELDHHRRTGKW